MAIYVLDTNIITDILYDNKEVIKKIQKLILEGNEIYVNVISYYEVKRGILSAIFEAQKNKDISNCKKFQEKLNEYLRNSLKDTNCFHLIQ
jgi:predicted nucleic acid-binding protein